MSADQSTVKTYDDSAGQIVSHFHTYGGPTALQEIDPAFDLAGRTRVKRVLEIGCGSGKHAYEIIKRTDWYEGFDPSGKLLELARAHVPNASFVQADALTYAYPPHIDIVFAFASMLHLDRNDFAVTCNSVAASLKPAGIFCMTLKEGDEYTEYVQEDSFGKRLFFLYTPSLVRELSGPSFKLVHESHSIIGPHKKRWMFLIFERLAKS